MGRNAQSSYCISRAIGVPIQSIFLYSITIHIFILPTKLIPNIEIPNKNNTSGHFNFFFIKIDLKVPFTPTLHESCSHESSLKLKSSLSMFIMQCYSCVFYVPSPLMRQLLLTAKIFHSRRKTSREMKHNNEAASMQIQIPKLINIHSPLKE